MKLGRCLVQNFGSYEELDFDFADTGLSLIYGRTGSGKSTIPDIPAWCLFGVTAKDGNADDVRPWGTTAPTQVDLEVTLGDGTTIVVTRIRGRQNENDLYWTEAADPTVTHRGRDLPDTQRKLEGRLAVSAESYLAGCYFHEFSGAGNFFVARAKDRREVFEKIAPLDLPARLAKEASEAKKSAKAEVAAAQGAAARASGEITSLQRSIADAANRSASWALEQMTKLDDLATKGDGFEAAKFRNMAAIITERDKFEAARHAKRAILLGSIAQLNEQIEELAGADVNIPLLSDKIAELERVTCKECGGPKGQEECSKFRRLLDKARETIRTRERFEAQLDADVAAVEALASQTNPFIAKLEVEQARENTFAAQAEAVGKASNPFLSQVTGMQEREAAAMAALKMSMVDLAEAEQRLSALEQLYSLSGALRGELLKKAVADIQENCNRILESYFDGEIRIALTLTGADGLDVEIQKSGNLCVYKQLSKGQRQLLKLSFVVSIMKASANRIGAHFDTIFFDEALDGLDTDLKVKAFSLFSELETEHSSVLLIDHAPEFQNLFSRRYFVAMSPQGTSEIAQDEA